jgi:predicted membrane-bound spermidine synthase
MISVRDPQDISRPRKLPSLYFLFLISGFSALIYQTAYQWLLGLFAGSDSLTVSIVVGAFLLGLGLGSVAASAYADRLSRRGALFAFAACELGIFGFAIFSKAVFYDLIFHRMIGLASSRPLIFLVAFLALLVPTILMGASLPLLSKAIVRGIDTAAANIAGLYGINTLGAAAGAFVSGFYLVGTFGYPATITLAGLLNLVAALGSIGLALSLPTQRSDQGRAANDRKPVALTAIGRWCLWLFISGFIAISLEIIWFRVLQVILVSTAYTFSLPLGLVLVGDALGILLGAYVLKRITDPWRAFFWLQGVITLGAIVGVWFVAPEFSRLFRPVIFWIFLHGFATLPASPVSVSALVAMAGLIALMVIPPSVLLGLSFPIAQKAIQDDPAVVGRRVGLIQFANILGNAAGSFVTGLVFLELLGTAGSLRLLAVLGALFVAALMIGEYWTAASARRQTVHALLLVGLATTVLVLPGGAQFYAPIHTAVPERSIVAEDRTGISLMEYETPVSGKLYMEGLAQSIVPFSAGHTMLGLLGPMVHPHPRTALIIGLGTGGTAYAAGARRTIESVKIVDILGSNYTAMRGFRALGGKTAVDGYLSDPRYQFVVGDARHVMFTDPATYDVIEADALYPQASNSGFLYSVEYFRRVRTRLNPGGICVQWAASWAPRITNSFLAVFPYVVERDHVLLGSDRPIDFDIETIVGRLTESDGGAYFAATAAPVDALVKSIRAEPIKLWAPDSPRDKDLDTDLFPKDEFYLNLRKIDLGWPFGS